MSKQKSDSKNQQINFIGRLEQNATIFFIVDEKETTGLKFLQILWLLYKKWNHKKL